MKYIPLRNIEASESNTAIDYADAIRTVIRQPLDQQRGVNIEEMRRGIRILDRLETGKDTLELEDADYDHLKAKVEAMSWGMVDRNILDFIDTVLNASETSKNGQVVGVTAKVS